VTLELKFLEGRKTPKLVPSAGGVGHSYSGASAWYRLDWIVVSYSRVCATAPSFTCLGQT
jgi:hypothetical protein